MIGAQIAPGLWRWSTYHAEWRQQVGSVAIRREGEVVLIDPLLADADWAALEAIGEAELHVLLTLHWHVRDAAQILERRPRTRIWAQRRDLAPVKRRTPVTDVFRPGDELPAGLEARPCRRSTEVLFWDPPTRALIAGDAIIGDGAGGVRLCPDSWLPSGASAAEMRDSLRPLLGLPVEHVLVSHGEPVLGGGRAALAKALA